MGSSRGMTTMKYKNTAIVVEGGGLRGAYAGGILDILADKEIKFGGAIGTCAVFCQDRSGATSVSTPYIPKALAI